MKKCIKRIAAGLALTLLLGILSACGGIQAEPSPSTGPPIWAEPLRWRYVILQIGDITDEIIEQGYPKDVVFRGAICKVLYCNAYEERNVDETIYFPEEFLSTASRNELFFVMLDASIYDYGNKKPMAADVFDGKLQAAPFVDGRLVYDEPFRKIEVLNGFLERVPTLVGKAAQFVDLLPSEPLKAGASVEDVIQFFEQYKAYADAYHASF